MSLRNYMIHLPTSQLLLWLSYAVKPLKFGTCMLKVFQVKLENKLFQVKLENKNI